MTIDELLEPVSDESPVGEDLTYDAERQAIEQPFDLAAEGGDAADSVDWRETIQLIEGQSRRTKDVWLAVYLARAGARMGNLETIDTGCQMLAGLFERYWDTLHPTLEEYGFQGRKGPCESLTRIGEFLGPFRRTVLIEHPRLGRFTGEDLDRFSQEGDAAEGFGMFRAAIAETPVEDIQAAIDRLDSIRDAIRRADAIMMTNADGDTGTNFQTTYETIESIRRGLTPYAGIADEPSAEGAEAAAPSNDSGGPRIAGRVDSREDVMKALDAIGDYYQRREPGSPIPVVLRRARSWVTMDFMTILNDISPNSVSEAKTVLVARSENDDNSSY
jgi:type VI secretion system protein ImpA